jgi:hypothetical protein
MTRARLSLLLPLLALMTPAIAACRTERKPLTGFDKPPPGIVLDSDPGGFVMLWPIFDLPQEPQQTFRPRLNGQDAVVVTSNEGFYDYAKVYLQGWTGGWSQGVSGFPPGTYVFELVDGGGQSFGKSPPLAVSAGAASPFNYAGQLPAVVFAHFGGQVGSWTIDPTTQDADAATAEITVTNLLDEGVVVERCLVAGGARTSCVPVGTVGPQADLLTVETMAASSKDDHQALFIHLATDASQSYQRDLVQGQGNYTFGSTCQVERIIVHGTPPIPAGSPTGVTAFAMSSCYGNASGSSSP